MRKLRDELRLAWLALGLGLGALAQQQPGQPRGVANPAPFSCITGGERLQWFVQSTVGPVSLLAAGPISAGWGTLMNNPEEYGPHWEGFGKRYGMRLTGVSTGNAIEALSGALLGEDPRYRRAPAGSSFGRRTKHIIVSSFMAYRPDGSWRFSYSRAAGNVGNNFLSNLWRAQSESSAADAGLRCVWGITSRMGGHAFAEFWPDIRKKIKK